MREEAVQQALDEASPVPADFGQAVSWAAGAAMKAVEAGNPLQSMYFYTGSAENEVSGEIGGILSFAEQLARAFSKSKVCREGSGVRVLFTDMGAAAMVSNRWQTLPEGLALDYFPPVTRDTNLSPSDKNKLESIMEASILVAVAPTQNELPAILRLLELMKSAGKEIPLVLINPKLLTNAALGAGTLMRNYKEMSKNMIPVFHLEQYDPAEENLNLSPAVISRIWPRPYSTWEDAPEDPEQIDGYFLLDNNPTRSLDSDEVKNLLTASRDVRKKIMELAPAPTARKRDPTN